MKCQIDSNTIFGESIGRTTYRHAIGTLVYRMVVEDGASFAKNDETYLNRGKSCVSLRLRKRKNNFLL